MSKSRLSWLFGGERALQVSEQRPAAGHWLIMRAITPQSGISDISIVAEIPLRSIMPRTHLEELTRLIAQDIEELQDDLERDHQAVHDMQYHDLFDEKPLVYTSPFSEDDCGTRTTYQLVTERGERVTLFAMPKGLISDADAMIRTSVWHGLNRLFPEHLPREKGFGF